MRNPKFNAILEEIQRLHDSKSHDYTPDSDPLHNLRRAADFGIEPWRGVLVRLSDKWSRIEQLAAGKTAKHESLRDSLIDNAVYSLLAIILLDEQAAPAGYHPAEFRRDRSAALLVGDQLGVPVNVP